ncbi:MAG: serine hydrolase [Ruminococcaceae bacterium]|nr:serine hydrolase [Oscillospiraceae bacterium]
MKEKVLDLIKILEENNTGCEAICLYQNGETVLEKVFVKSPERCIYSHTKSFVSTAAGIAIDEGKLSLDHKLWDMFPEYAYIDADESIKKITLRHLLTMSSGIGTALLMGESRKKGEGMPDYIEYYLSRKPKFAPGERFLYSNGDSHMAGCMVSRAVGMKLQEYLYEKLFKKLDIGYPAWEADPKGNAFGGSGLYMSLQNMMKLGILYLNEGRWNGEQIVSSKWVKEAVKKQISTNASDRWCGTGYGYQFWVTNEEPFIYRAEGAYGQMSIVFPKDNAVVGIQSSEYNDMMRLIHLLFKYLI